MVGNLLSKFGCARSLGSRIIRYVRDGRTDRRTDNSNPYALCPLPFGREHKKSYVMYQTTSLPVAVQLVK